MRGCVVGRLGVAARGVSLRGVSVRGGDAGRFGWVFRDGVVGLVLGCSVRGVVGLVLLGCSVRGAVALGVVARRVVVGLPAAGACVGMGPAADGGMAPGGDVEGVADEGPVCCGMPASPGCVPRAGGAAVAVPPMRLRSSSSGWCGVGVDGVGAWP